MNKNRNGLILGLVLYLFCFQAKADGGLCSVLLAEKDPKVSRVELQLHAYLSELFAEGVLQESELTDFRDSLTHTDLINPIQNPDLSIDRLIAFQKIEEFLPQISDRQILIEEMNRLLDTNQEKDKAIENIIPEITGLEFQINTQDSDELLKTAVEHFSKPESVTQARLLEKAIARLEPKHINILVGTIFSKEHWTSHPELLVLALKKMDATRIEGLAHLFDKPLWNKSPETLRTVLEQTIQNNNANGVLAFFTRAVFSTKHWVQYPELLSLAISGARVELGIYASIFSDKTWIDHPKILKNLLLKISRNADHDEGYSSGNISENTIDRFIENVFINDNWVAHPELIRILIEKQSSKMGIARAKLGGAIRQFYPSPLREVFLEALDIDNWRWSQKERAQYLEQNLGPLSLELNP